MQLSDFGTASFDSFFRPYRVHQDGVKSSQVTGNEFVMSGFVSTAHYFGSHTSKYKFVSVFDLNKMVF